MKYYAHTMYKMYKATNVQYYNGQYLAKIYVSVSSIIIFNPLFS